MAPSATYVPDERSQGVRLKKRTLYDAELVHGILNSVPVLHVAFNAPGGDGPQFPTVLPMLGCVATPPSSTTSEESDPVIYLHGSSVARLFKMTAGGEIPLTVAATHIDGYVLALAPFHNSCNYRSAVAFGYGSLVSDEEEVSYALKSITNNSVPQRWENSRSTPSKAELTATGVLKVRIETASAKTRTGGPSDDKADMNDGKLADGTWVGVVPTYMALGQPMAADHNKVKAIPEYLDDWVQDVNSLNEQKAVDAVDS
nr:hypothetical protein CFP56_31717 [Quercus suber]